MAALFFKFEIAYRLGYTNPLRTLLSCKWNQNLKQDRHMMSLYMINYLHNGVMFQVTPAELIDIEFIKPKHIKNHEQQDNTSALQAKRMKVTGGPAEH